LVGLVPILIPRKGREIYQGKKFPWGFILGRLPKTTETFGPTWVKKRGALVKPSLGLNYFIKPFLIFPFPRGRTIFHSYQILTFKGFAH